LKQLVARSKRAVPPYLYAEMLGQMGITPDAFALRLEFGRTDRGGMARDLMALSHLLDRYAELDRPIAISALGAPATPFEQATPAGAWHSGWTEENQAAFFEAAATIALAKPFVTSVCCQGLGDEPQGTTCGLVSPDGRKRPVADTLARLRETLRAKDASLIEV